MRLTTGEQLPDAHARVVRRRASVTRGHHLVSMPGNRMRVAADRLLDVTVGRQPVQLGLVRSPAVPLDTAAPETAAPPPCEGLR